MSIALKWEFIKNLQKQENVDSLDVRIHHRIWDAKKHLLQTLNKQTEMLIENNTMGVIIQ